ncbi:MAG: hypothetical protein AAF417_21770 [Pseudomonadota bacterium]
MDAEETGWLQLFADGPGSGSEAVVMDVSTLMAMPAAERPDSVVIVASMDAGGVLARLSWLLLLRLRLHRIRLRLTAIGYAHGGSYFAYPDLERPYLIAELKPSALRYSRTHLVFNSRSRVKRLAVTVLTKLSGCSPFAAGVIVTGFRE